MKNKKLMGSVAIIFIILLVSFFSSQAQETSSPKKKIPEVGVLQYVSHPALDEIYRGIKAGLKQEGYDPKKQTVKINFQNGQADQSKLKTMSEQLVNKQADVLVGIATPAAQALANTTQKTPIVLGAITDPVSAGLVKSNEKPGGNITGVSDQSPVAAQIELAKKLLPQAKKMGILYSSSEANSEYQANKASTIAKKAGIESKNFPVNSTNDLLTIVQEMANQVDFIYIPTDNTIANAMQTVVGAANNAAIPIIPSVDTMVEQGGLATVGINQYDLGVKTGQMVAMILKGKSKPATTPIYTFTKGDIIINQEQAEKLGISIPDSIKQQATLVSADKTKK